MHPVHNNLPNYGGPSGSNKFSLPRKNKEQNSFSIPKILVAVLIFIVIGIFSYILLIKKKQQSTLNYLQQLNKQTERELNTMTKKYNLSSDDNTQLEKKITEVQKDTKIYKDSIISENKRKRDSLLQSK